MTLEAFDRWIAFATPCQLRRRMMSQSPMHFACGPMQVMYDADMLKLLPKVTCPALLVVGEKDFR